MSHMPSRSSAFWTSISAYLRRQFDCVPKPRQASLVGRERVDGLVKEGKAFSEYRLVAEYDFILTTIPGSCGGISFEKIQNFFLWLRDKCGYRFGLITADMYQSKAPLQMLEARGFNVGERSVDRDKSVYNCMARRIPRGMGATFPTKATLG
jgi:hypothetical protein